MNGSMCIHTIQVCMYGGGPEPPVARQRVLARGRPPGSGLTSPGPCPGSTLTARPGGRGDSLITGFKVFCPAVRVCDVLMRLCPTCQCPHLTAAAQPVQGLRRQRASASTHGRQRTQCKDCGGGSICEHGRERSRCKDCGGGTAAAAFASTVQCGYNTILVLY